MSTFVTVGNATQPFDRLLRAVADISAELPHPIVVQRGTSTISHRDWDSREFFGMAEFEQLVNQSAILIMHAGAGSVIHAVRAERMPIVMPRRSSNLEHIDEHQLEFATALASLGYVILAREASDLHSAVRMAFRSRGTRVAAPTQLAQHVSQLLARLALTGS
jgi:UDP-N-acetylglucosamine transferase subunit ALG13